MTPNRITEKTLRQIQKEYNDALERAVRKSREFWKRAERVQSGKVKPPAGLTTQAQIDGWKRAYVTRAMKTTNAVEKMANEISGAGMNVRKSIRQSMQRLYSAENKRTLKTLDKAFSSGLSPMKQKEIAKLLDARQTAFDKIALGNLTAKGDIAQRLRREMAAAIARGDDQKKMLKRIQIVTGKKESDAKRILRTESTRIRGEAMQDTAEEWQSATGRIAMKRWHCVFHNSRDTHMEMNGQEVPVEERFVSKSGATFAYPGDDEDADASEIVNCQCWMEVFADDGEVLEWG